MKRKLHCRLEKVKWIRVGFILLLLSGIVVVSVRLAEKHKIVQVKTSITVEAGNELELKATDFFEADAKIMEKILFYTGNVDIYKVGSYKAEAKFGNQVFPITVNVEDTTAPILKFSKRYMFTSNIENMDNIMEMLEQVEEVSAFTMRLLQFEKKDMLQVLEEDTLDKLVRENTIFYAEDKKLDVAFEELPQEEGIYQAILEVIDIYGNAVYEKIIVVLDKTGAYIEEVPDKIIEVEVADIEKEPEIDATEYKVFDNVDGSIAPEELFFELELKDKEKHEWIVHLCYIDRAGNESRGDFLVLMQEKRESETIIEMVQKDSKIENIEMSLYVENGTSSLHNKKPDNSKNKNENEWVVTEDENDISPWEQKVIDAGYGIVVDFGNGSYGVLTHNDGYVNGKRGGEILRTYLTKLGLKPQNVSGGVIDEDADWRWYIADNIYEADNWENDW